MGVEVKAEVGLEVKAEAEIDEVEVGLFRTEEERVLLARLEVPFAIDVDDELENQGR